jgi:hypothetical protein
MRFLDMNRGQKRLQGSTGGNRREEEEGECRARAASSLPRIFYAPADSPKVEARHLFTTAYSTTADVHAGGIARSGSSGVARGGERLMSCSVI